MGGFLGSNARYLLGGWVAERLGPLFPYHTMIINVSGSFLLGLFMPLALQLPLNSRRQLGFALGFLGVYTTFPTYEYKSLDLLTGNRAMWAAVNLAGSSIVGLVAVWLGMIAGHLMLEGVS